MRRLIMIPILILLLHPNKGNAQEIYHEDPNLEYFNSATMLFGVHINKFDPLFEALNFNVLDETGVYDLSGSLIADSTNFIGRGNYFGLGINVNGIQFLPSVSFRRSVASNFYQLGLGVGFNHIVHFSYKTGQPLIWFEGLVNYSYLKHNTRLKYYETNLFPLMVIDGTPFPDIGENIEGSYRLNVEFNKHIIEPVAAINFGLTKSIGLRFAVAYSFFLNGDNADLVLRFRPDAENTNGDKRARMSFNRNIDRVNLDGNAITQNHLDMRRWNFNISLVFRLGSSQPMSTTGTTIYD